MKIYFKRPLRGLNESIVYIHRKAPITAPTQLDVNIRHGDLDNQKICFSALVLSTLVLQFRFRNQKFVYLIRAVK